MKLVAGVDVVAGGWTGVRGHVFRGTPKTQRLRWQVAVPCISELRLIVQEATAVLLTTRAVVAVTVRFSDCASNGFGHF